MLFGVKSIDTSRRCLVCCGSSSLMNSPGGDSMPGLDHVDRSALRRDEVVLVGQHSLDVVESAHGEEVVLLVVVERRFVAQPPVDLVRIRLDVEIERVEVDVARGQRHVASL